MKQAAAIFVIVGLLMLGYCAYVYWDASRFQSAGKVRFTSPPAEPEKPPRSAPPSRGEPVALLTIPRIGLSEMVLQGAGAGELKRGPGHISWTSLPGEGGNFAVAGHRDTFFRPLRSIQVNDEVRVKSLDREFQYRVVSTGIVEPENVSVLDSTGRDTLTLVTCYPFDFVGAAPRRFIVHADCESCSGK